MASLLNGIRHFPGYLDRPAQENLVELIRGIVTEAWSPLGRGQVLEDPVIGALAAEHKVSAAQIILRWQLQLGNVTIPKASSAARIRENLDVFGFELSALDMTDIEALERGHRTGSHPDNVN